MAAVTAKVVILTQVGNCPLWPTNSRLRSLAGGSSAKAEVHLAVLGWLLSQGNQSEYLESRASSNKPFFLTESAKDLATTATMLLLPIQLNQFLNF